MDWYSILFLGLPVVGIAAYIAVVWHMRVTNVAEPPAFALFTIFAAYGAVLLFWVSWIFGAYSAMHAATLVALCFGGLLFFSWQSYRLRPLVSRSRFHAASYQLSRWYPLAFASIFVVAALVDLRDLARVT